MEVPAAPSGSPETADRSEARPAHDAIDREACAFLARRILPGLSAARRTVLGDAVRTAVREESLGPLRRLAERHRRELLEAIESRVESSAQAGSARAIVRLTSIISATPVPEHGHRRRLAPPAR